MHRQEITMLNQHLPYTNLFIFSNDEYPYKHNHRNLNWLLSISGRSSTLRLWASKSWQFLAGMASVFRCLLLSPENAPFDEFIFSIKFCEIFQGFIKNFQGFIKNFQGFSRVSRDFQGLKNFPGFSRISRARTNPESFFGEFWMRERLVYF